MYFHENLLNKSFFHECLAIPLDFLVLASQGSFTGNLQNINARYQPSALLAFQYTLFNIILVSQLRFYVNN